jgi:hypothetical protein
MRLLRTLPLVLMCALALRAGVRTTQGLIWPPDPDLHRNMSQAQTMVDGDLWADPYYLDESVWYNPLSPFVVAVLAWTTGLPVPMLYAQAGTYLNLLGPLAFYAMVNLFFGRGPAVAATFSYLFLADRSDPPWARATYTPWLFAQNFAQAFFYAGLAAYWRAAVSRRRAWFAGTGALLGLAFLGHAAPAIVLGGVVLAEWGRRLLRGDRSAWADHACVLAAALAVAFPFLASIVGVYRLHVVNPAGNDWVWAWLDLKHAPKYVFGHLDVTVVVTGLGLALLVRRRRDLPSRLVLWWASLSSVFVAYGLASQLAEHVDVHLLNVVAVHHFWFYLTAACAVLWGLGLAEALSWVARHAARRSPRLARLVVQPRWRAAAVLGLVTVGVVVVAPSYLAMNQFADARQAALREGRAEWRGAARKWIRAHTSPRDVFLAFDELAQGLVGPAGRKTVALAPNFASPYVPWEPRARDRRAMFLALWNGDEAGFLALASRYRVTHVAHRDVQGPLFDEARLPSLTKAFERGPVTIYRVRSEGGAQVRRH